MMTGLLSEGFAQVNHKLDKLDERFKHMATDIKTFAAAVKASFDKIGTAVDGLTQDIKTLNDKITQLQNSPGTITPEDQALLDEVQAQAGSIADKVAALDDQTAAPPAPTP